MNRDKEIQDVAAQLEALLDDLRDSVQALSAILAPPAAPLGPEQESTREPA